jgi:plasmid stabilization system protein ParE
MKRFRIRLQEEAEAQLNQIEAWWRRHRREHPDLVAEELAEAGRTLAAAPEAGESFPRRRGVRRLLLPRSQYWIYYRVDDDAHDVRIMAIWHTSRGKGPPLR